MTRQVVTFREPVAEITAANESASVTTLEPVATVTVDAGTENVNVTVDESVAIIAAPAERINVSIIEPAVSVIWPPGPSGPTGPEGPAGENMPGNLAMPYSVNGTWQTSTYMFVGMTDEDGAWYVRRVALDASSILHATILNNPLIADYDAAVAARLTLTYGRFDEAF